MSQDNLSAQSSSPSPNEVDPIPNIDMQLDTGKLNTKNKARIGNENNGTEEETKKGVRQMFTTEEDNLLIEMVKEYGDKNWRVISKHIPNRTTRQCRERYRNYLSPTIKNGPWTEEEDLLLEQKYMEYGPKWATIAQFFKSRSDVNIKNRWSSNRHKATRTAPQTLLESLLIPKRQFLSTLQTLLLPQIRRQQQLLQQQKMMRYSQAFNNINNNALNNMYNMTPQNSNNVTNNSNNIVNDPQQPVIATMHEEDFIPLNLPSDDDHEGILDSFNTTDLIGTEDFDPCLNSLDICQPSFATEFDSLF